MGDSVSWNYGPGNPENTVQAADAGRGGRSDVGPQVQPSGCQAQEVGPAGSAGFSEEVGTARDQNRTGCRAWV